MRHLPTVLALALALAAAPLAAQKVLHVDAAVAAPGDGSSWTKAFADLGKALGQAGKGDEVRVAGGTYAGGFVVPAGVRLLGGYLPGAVLGDERDPGAVPTVLDGQKKQRVLEAGDGAVVDGFVVRNGVAGDPGGGGLLVRGTSPIVRRCRFEGCANTGGRGATLHVIQGGAPLVESCVFTLSQGSGHVIDVTASKGVFRHITVANNKSNGLHFHQGSTVDIRNSVFASNTGRGICHISTTDNPTVRNNLFWNNTIGVYHYQGKDFKQVSDLNALAYASGNIEGDPAFTAASDFRPKAGSPCLEAGDPVLVHASHGPWDLDGNGRRLDSLLKGSALPDLGAFERAALRLSLDMPLTRGKTSMLALDGDKGLPALLLVSSGRTPAPLEVLPFGVLAVDPGAGFFLPGPTLPGKLVLAVPPTFVPGSRVALQAITWMVPGIQLSNLVDASIR